MERCCLGIFFSGVFCVIPALEIEHLRCPSSNQSFPPLSLLLHQEPSKNKKAAVHSKAEEAVGKKAADKAPSRVSPTRKEAKRKARDADEDEDAFADENDGGDDFPEEEGNDEPLALKPAPQQQQRKAAPPPKAKVADGTSKQRAEVEERRQAAVQRQAASSPGDEGGRRLMAQLHKELDEGFEVAASQPEFGSQQPSQQQQQQGSQRESLVFLDRSMLSLFKSRVAANPLATLNSRCAIRTWSGSLCESDDAASESIHSRAWPSLCQGARGGWTQEERSSSPRQAITEENEHRRSEVSSSGRHSLSGFASK